MSDLRILCVEDNEADVGLLLEALDELGVRCELHHVVDGERGLAFLRREGTYAAAPRVDLVLLDLNLPRKSGYEVLPGIAGDPELRALEVVVLTTTAREVDVTRAARGMAVRFFTKPVGFAAFVAIVRAIIEHAYAAEGRRAGAA